MTVDYLQISRHTVTSIFQYLQLPPCYVYCQIPLLANSAGPYSLQIDIICSQFTVCGHSLQCISNITFAGGQKIIVSIFTILVQREYNVP